MRNMRLLYTENEDLATVVLEVTRFSKSKRRNYKGPGLWNKKEQAIRTLLEGKLRKINRYNSRVRSGIYPKNLDRIRIFYISKPVRLLRYFFDSITQRDNVLTKFPINKEVHYHVYQGPKEKLDEILTFCENNNISVKGGIGNCLRGKYSKMHGKNIQELLKI
jgi:hypothetical protein